MNLTELKQRIKQLAGEFGFQQMSVANIDTSEFFPEFRQWVSDGYHGEMSFLERNQSLRQNPDELHPDTCRIISLRYNYLPESAKFTQVLEDPTRANISRYALGRDYHKLIRKKLQKLASSISKLCDSFEYRVFVDSAPVLETSFANKSGLGWKGKHTLIINKEAGSWFFLGEIFINLELEVDEPVENECGKCTSCINLCPTGAIIAPYKVDARKCISYLTIENQSAIPIDLRAKMGNRIYGCDDCQLACPWNRFSATTADKAFTSQNGLDSASLLSLWLWTEQDFYKKLEGSPIRRIGYQNWLRNIAVALGNGEYAPEILKALEEKKSQANSMVAEHIEWAINQLENRTQNSKESSAQTTRLIRSIKKMMPRDA